MDSKQVARSCFSMSAVLVPVSRPIGGRGGARFDARRRRGAQPKCRGHSEACPRYGLPGGKGVGRRAPKGRPDRAQAEGLGQRHPRQPASPEGAKQSFSTQQIQINVGTHCGFLLAWWAWNAIGAWGNACFALSGLGKISTRRSPRLLAWASLDRPLGAQGRWPKQEISCPVYYSTIIRWCAGWWPTPATGPGQVGDFTTARIVPC